MNRLMRNSILFLLVITCLLGTYAQSTPDSVPKDPILLVPIDTSGNIGYNSESVILPTGKYTYESSNGVLKKYDQNGKLLFSQSIKSLGQTKQLEAINAMKLVHFSEEQQSVCFFDNTLTQSQDCIDLGERGFLNVTRIATSAQPDKIWVLDQVNSRLVLMPFQGETQRQEISNLRGILEIDSIQQIIEANNQLFVLDRNKGIHAFDMYGTLLGVHHYNSIRDFAVTERYLLILLDNDVLLAHERITDVNNLIYMPLKGVTEMQFADNYLFLAHETGVHKFALQFSN